MHLIFTCHAVLIFARLCLLPIAYVKSKIMLGESHDILTYRLHQLARSTYLAVMVPLETHIYSLSTVVKGESFGSGGTSSHMCTCGCSCRSQLSRCAPIVEVTRSESETREPRPGGQRAASSEADWGRSSIKHQIHLHLAPPPIITLIATA